MNRIAHRSKSGSYIATSALVAMCMGTLVLAIAKVVRNNAQSSFYLEQLNKSFLLNETGVNEALGQITKNAAALYDPGFSDWRSPESLQSSGARQRYRYSATQVDFPDPTGAGTKSGYYLVTTSERTIGSKTLKETSHTYAVTSNIGDYFLAVKTSVDVGMDVQAYGGKIYASTLTFTVDRNPATLSILKRADYFDNCRAKDVSMGLPYTYTQCENFNFSSDVSFQEPPGQKPVKLTSQLLFPQLSESDIEYYRSKAHTSISDPTSGHAKCSFSDEHVFPPGYSGTQNALDLYAGHTTDNYDHVYFCDSDMSISSITVHGQVIFFAVGNIIINGDILRHNDKVQTDPMAELPGTGVAASAAHQAVLITRQNVIINNTMTFGPAPQFSTQTIEAMLVIPEGEFVATAYADTSLHNRLRLVFRGSWIARNMNPTIPNVFSCSTHPARVYSYMTTLQTNPPPDIPNLSEIYYYFQDRHGFSEN